MSEYTRRTFLTVSGSVLGGIAAGGTVTAATVDGRYIVDTQSLSQSALERSELTVDHDLPEVDLAVVSGAEADVEALGVDYGADTSYDLDLPVAEAPIKASESATDEPYYGLQWDKQVQEVPAVHDRTRGENTRVAIIDSGVGAGHPDLQHAVNADLSRNFTGDDLGAPGPWGGYHGTHVAGIVASDDGNETGVVGTAPGTELVDCRVFSPSAPATFGGIVAAMVYSGRIGADAANLSLGAYPVERKGLGSFYGRVLNRTTTYVNSQGTVLVVAAGNDGADLQHDGGGVAYYDADGDGDTEKVVHSAFVSLPNESAGVMSVSATGPNGFNWGADGLEAPPESPAYYTNYGTNAIDIGAPGGDADPSAIGTDAAWYHDLVFNTIAEVTTETAGNGRGNGKGNGNAGKTSTDIEYGYAWLAGTSMAAPQVAGAVALLRSVDSGLNANQVKKTLQQTASVPADYEKTYYGHGFIDLPAAVNDAE